MEESTREVLYLVKIKNDSVRCVLASSGAFRPLSEAFSASLKGKVVPITARRKRKLSTAAIALIHAAQKARFAKWRRG